MREMHRHRKAMVRIQKNVRTWAVSCLDCWPSKVGTVDSWEAACQLREEHRAEVHPNGVESHRARELAKEYRNHWR